ncbi:MAG: phosphoribosylformylglycinamidine cyclo-ligase [Candidatus Hydrothermales bacterium]
MRYKEAGVDLKKAESVSKIFKIITKQKERFSGIFDLGDYFVAATCDGVGTKTQVARIARKFEVLGEDIVNHSVNDLLCQGAKPIFFLDYIASSSLDLRVVRKIAKGILKALRENGNIALLGGETAEMPDIYNKNEWDIVGFCVGLLKKENLLPKKIKKGDLLLGLPSNGLHTNGYSLARKVLLKKYDLNKKFEGKTLKSLLLKPHKSYFKILYPLIEKKLIKGLAHITGGGIEGNLKRILPNSLGFDIDIRDVEKPIIFEIIQKEGNVPYDEMLKVFNLGIGMIVVIDVKELENIKNFLIKKGEKFYIIGEITKGRKRVIF